MAFELPPTRLQLAILRGLAQGWTLCERPLQVGVFDSGGNFKRGMNYNTFRLLRDRGWLEVTGKPREWRISKAGRMEMDANHADIDPPVTAG